MVYIDHATNTLHGGPEPHDYADGTASLGQLCHRRLTAHGDQALLIDALTDQRISATQLRDRAATVAQRLRANGAACVAVSSLNCAEFAYVVFGAAMAGVRLAPMNVTYSENELLHAIKLSKPSIVFSDALSHDRVAAAARRTPHVRSVIQFGDAFDKFIDHQPTTEKPFTIAAQSIDRHIALVLCSSGTTGLPKGVGLTERNVMVGLHQHMIRPDAREEERLAPEPIVLGILPWFHAFGIMSLMGFVLYGRRLVFLPRFEETAFLAAIPRHRINTLYLVPPIMVFLAKHPAVRPAAMRSLRIIWCGAAPLSADLELAVRQRLCDTPQLAIRQGYGMTEATYALCGQSDSFRTAGSVGRLRHGLCARVVDPETGRPLGVGHTGELLFKGSVVMGGGYVGDSAATAATVDAAGWLHTGDIGYYSADGEIFVVDRLKELIKCNGFQVPPAELEAMLLEHADVMDAGVVGVADERRGEVALAFVVRRPGSELTEAEVQRFVAERTSPAKRLHGGVCIVDAIPKSPSGKILRKELRQMVVQSRVVSKL